MVLDKAPSHRTRIKVCGLTDPETALVAVQAGADAIGLMFVPVSKRLVSLSKAQAIANALAGRVCRVGVFADAAADQVQQTLDQVELDLLQFHGIESPQYCESFGLPYCKVLAATPGVDLLATAQQYAGARYLMVDAVTKGRFGGTGVRFDSALWPDAARWVDSGEPDAQVPGAARWVLAGGLDPGNVQQAVTQLQPYAVDVSTGVEVVQQNKRVAGRKDPAQIADFIVAVRQADAARTTF